MSAPPPAIEAVGLTVSYRRGTRRLAALSDISLRIERGEAYGLVGESGSGKSTLALALMRYLPGSGRIDSGQIRLGGDDVLAASERTLRRWRGRRIALVSQSAGSALNPSLRIGTQMREVYRTHGDLLPAEAAEASARALSQVRIGDPARTLRRYPHELAAGQQQRVLIAMALAGDPAVLVLDEPTTALDATVEAEVLDLVESLRAEVGTAILLISHDIRIVAQVCNRAGVLYAGRLVEEGPAGDVIRDPRHPYTLALLRCTPRLDVTGTPDRLEPLPGRPPDLGRAVFGCVFADRCPIARERCHRELPPAYSVAEGRTSRCHYHQEVPGTPAAPPVPRSWRPPEDEPPLLRVDRVSKTYRAAGARVEAVTEASFDVRRGEIFGLVGESGSGKTSLARCIVGLAEPTAGSVELEGQRLARSLRRRNGEERRAVQLVFQNADGALNRAIRIRGTLGRSLRRLGGPNGVAAVDDLASLVRLSPSELELRPAALSGGMKQRVAIARALVGSPSLVVCDEPVSDLDVSVQAAIVNLFGEIRERDGVSFVFISHDLAVVRYVADRVGVMYLGGLVEVGPADVVFEPPHHPYTEALVSAVPPLALDEPRPRITLFGRPPSASNPPTGCRFHTRCPRYLGELCEAVEPPWQQHAEGHRYRCHIPPRELGDAQRTDRLAGRPPSRAAVPDV